MERAAFSLAVDAKLMWTQYCDAGKAEKLITVAEKCPSKHPLDTQDSLDNVVSPGEKTVGEDQKEELTPEDAFLDEWEMVEKPEGADFEVVRANSEAVATSVDGERCLALCLVGQLQAEVVVMTAAEAEAKYVQRAESKFVRSALESSEECGGCGDSNDVVRGPGSLGGDVEVNDELRSDFHPNNFDSVHDNSAQQEREIARTLAGQVEGKWAVVMATKAQTRYLETVGGERNEKASYKVAEVPESLEMREDLVVEDGLVDGVAEKVENIERLNLEGDLGPPRETAPHLDNVMASKDDVMDEGSLSEDRLIFSETDGTEVEDDLEEKSPEREKDGYQSQLALSSSLLDDTAIRPVLCDAETNTVPDDVQTCDVETNTTATPLTDRGCSPAPPPPVMIHDCAQTVLSIEDLESRVREKEELELLKVDLHVVQSNLTQERSQRLVAEELVKIIQSDLNTTSGRNTAEVMARMQAENDLTEVKGELSHCQRELKDKEERIVELEDTLKGTTLMVRKLEEQNATTLMNRGGIDYMLQARLADGRAKEAEQKLQMLQTELLQSQSEVRMLLDRVSESSRDRAEMVSSKVHNQLLSIADEKAAVAERRSQMMEREILELRRRLAAVGVQDGGGARQAGLTGMTSSGLTGYASSTMLGGTGLGLGSGIGGVGFGTGYGGMGSGIGGLGSGLGTGIGGLGSGLGTGIGGLGSGLGSMGYGSGGMGGIGSGLDGIGTGGLGTGLGSSAGIGSGMGGMSGMESGLGMRSGLGMGSSVPGMNLGLSGMSTAGTSTSFGSSLSDPTAASSSVSKTSSNHFMGSMGSGSESKSHDLGLKSHDLDLKAHDPTLKSHDPTLKSHDPSLKSHDPTLKSHDPTLKSHDPTLKSHDIGSAKPPLENGNASFSLPTFDSSSNIESDGKPLPRVKQTSGSHGDSDSSDWSSSEEEDGGGLSVNMKPSTHAALISEWEWRAMKKEREETPPHLTTSPQLSRRKPPPIAPKPTVFRTVLASGKVHFTVEPPSSFDEPSHLARLPVAQLRKPRGPTGRKVPLRWRKRQQQTLFYT